MFTYKRTRKQFLADMENDATINSVLQNLENEINLIQETTGKKVNPGDFSSWKPSMEKFRDIMDALGNDIEISFEYMMDFRNPALKGKPGKAGYNKRVDVMIGGHDSAGKLTIVIVEMKQWSKNLRFEKIKTGEEILTFYGGREDNPSKEVCDYCEQLKDSNEKVENGEIKLIPMVWLFNYKDGNLNDEIKKELENHSINTGTDDEIKVQVFYKDDAEKIKKQIVEIFQERHDAFSELRKGFKTIKLHSEIAGLLDTTKQYNVKLRTDQLSCVDGIKEKIDNKTTGMVYVHGRAGSGKSIVGITLLRYCLEKDINVQYVITEEAPRQKYDESMTEEQKKFFAQEIHPDLKRIKEQEYNVIIIDEGHNLYKKDYDNLKNLIQDDAKKNLVIILYDFKQVTNCNSCLFDTKTYSIKKDEFGCDYELLSQFRCNQDDGYLKLTDDILDNVDDPLCTADNIDFDVKLVESEGQLKKLAADKQYMVLAGPKYIEQNETIKVGNLEIKITDVDALKKLFLSPPESNSYTGANAVRGLETDHTVVIIGENNPKDKEGIKTYPDLHFAKGKITSSEIHKNAYRVMLSRATKSCYIYCMNEELRDYLHTNKKIRYLR